LLFPFLFFYLENLVNPPDITEEPRCGMPIAAAFMSNFIIGIPLSLFLQFVWNLILIRKYLREDTIGVS